MQIQIEMGRIDAFGSNLYGTFLTKNSELCSDRVLNNPPHKNLLQQFAQTRLANFIRQDAVKSFGGALMWLGFWLALGTGPVGIGVAVIGAALWLASTTLSAAASNKDMRTAVVVVSVMMIVLPFLPLVMDVSTNNS
jgi:hypothetical protein